MKDLSLAAAWLLIWMCALGLFGLLLKLAWVFFLMGWNLL